MAFAWLLVLVPWFWQAAVVKVTLADDPDALYADRERIASALLAADIWERRLVVDPNDFEAAWKVGRAGYWLGAHVDRDKSRAQYERGMAAARRAIVLQPERPEGHFWLAADMGAMAESFGLIAGIRYRGPVKRELEAVLRIDPAFQQGSADRALGRWYDKVPALFGGSNVKAVDHLQRSLAYDPGSAASHYFLAEVFLDMKRRADARAALQRVMDAPLHPEWIPEVKEFKEKARVLLAALE